MIQFAKKISVAIALVLGMVGCATEIVNVKDAPVKTLSGKELTLDQVTKAIVLAGMGLKWEMEVVEPGHIIGTLNLRSHMAVVDIPYTTKTFSIMFKDSRGLRIVDSNGETVGIHRNYNSWIDNLKNAIRKEFVAIGT